MADLDSVIAFNKITAYFQQVNTSLAQRPLQATKVTEEIAYVLGGLNAKMGREVKFSEGVGREIVFPLPMFGNMDKRRSGYEEIGFTKPEVCNFKLVLSEFAPDGEAISRGTQIADLYGIFKQQIPTIVDMGQATIETHTADLLGFGESATASTVFGIGGGNTDYDGAPHFAVGKRTNPNRVLATNNTFDNYDGALKLDRNGLVTVLDKLEAFPAPDGQIVTLPGRNVIVVSNEDQLERAQVLLRGTDRVGGTVISVGGAPVGVGGTESNQLKGRAEVFKLPALRNFNGGKGWYAFRVCGNHTGILVGIAEPPHAYVEGLSENEGCRVTKNVVRYGRRGFWGHGYGWPQLSFKAIEP